VAEPRYLSACTRATTVFAILTVFFCSQAGAGVFSAGAGKSTDIGSRGDADATIAACTKLIYETPLGASQAAAYIARGLAYETEKDYDRAIADYSEAIQLGNKSALMYDTRGRAYLYAGALTKALADFDKASELNPKNPYAALWLPPQFDRDVDVRCRGQSESHLLTASISELDPTRTLHHGDFL
jgi:tetratricopeptide (TPR) repeat protein